MSVKRTRREKLHDSKGFPKVIDASTSKRGGSGTFVIPSPLEVDALMRQCPAIAKRGPSSDSAGPALFRVRL
jgi:hypothetical protein